MKRESLSILFPWEDRIQYQVIPEETWHDLGLDTLVEKVARQPQEVQVLKRVMISLTDDAEVAAYRSDVFEDILAHPQIREQLMKLLEHVKMFYDYGVVTRHAGDEAGLWDLMHRLEEYHDYILTVEAIRECLSDVSLKSEGLNHLRQVMDTVYQDHGFAALKQDVEEMRVSASAVRSLTIGVNVNDRFDAVSMGLISVNGKPFTRSGLLKHFVSAVSPRDSIQQEADWNGSLSYQPADAPVGGVAGGMEQIVHTGMMMRNPLLGISMASIPREDGSAGMTRQMDSAASLLVSRLVRKLKDTLARYLNVSVKDVSDLIPELLFYVRWAEYLERLQGEGWRFCKPEAVKDSSGAPGMEAKGFYNLKLIGAEKPDSVVPNDLSFDAEKRIYVLTGANRGGKTTVTQAVGQLFLLAQSGIRVPGESFRYTPADQVLCHFPADEDKTMDLGRLGEECRRFRELYILSTGNSLLLLNETFSTTSFEEGYFIAVDAVRAILHRNTRTIYNTHMHKLAADLDEVINSPDVPGKAVSLVAETKEGRNSFRVRIAPPEGKSFARDIAEKYGVTYEMLTV